MLSCSDAHARLVPRPFITSQEMLFRRLAKVQLLTTASQQLEKARPDKRPIVRAAILE